MIKVEAIADFTLWKFEEIKIIERKGLDERGKLFTGDIFICTKEMCEYLMGKNRNNITVVKVLELIPDEPIKEDKPVKKTTKKKTSKKMDNTMKD